jgi:uncharacterized membrane protein (GlpM family)
MLTGKGGVNSRLAIGYILKGQDTKVPKLSPYNLVLIQVWQMSGQVSLSHTLSTGSLEWSIAILH